MLRALEPSDLSPAQAYAVPWLVDGRDPARVHVINASLDTLTGVHVTLLSTGQLLTRRAYRIEPAAALTFAFPANISHDADVAVVAWTREGVEYIYRVTL